MMEDETAYLSRETEKEESKVERIKHLLAKILFDLNEKKVTTIVGKSKRNLHIVKMIIYYKLKEESSSTKTTQYNYR